MSTPLISLTLPIYWNSGTKTVLTGMNWYRNAHYYTSNKWKQEFTELVDKQLDSCIIPSPFSLHLDIFYKNPNCDGSNIAALMEKVALDALQKANMIENDSVKHHISSSWAVAGQDKENPRCEITIRTLKK